METSGGRLYLAVAGKACVNVFYEVVLCPVMITDTANFMSLTSAVCSNYPDKVTPLHNAILNQMCMKIFTEISFSRSRKREGLEDKAKKQCRQDIKKKSFSQITVNE